MTCSKERVSMDSKEPLLNDSVSKSHQSYSLLDLCGLFFKGVVFLGGVYCMGAYGCSPSWILLAVSGWVIRENFLKEKDIRIATHQSASADEKGCILARLEDLPSWVFFPDTERAEWVNKILRQVWPFVGDYAKDLIKETIEPSIRECLPTYLQSFHFEKMDLGYCPPRIGGIKVYQENVSRNEIILDLELLYSGDCDFVVKIKSFRAGIRNFQIYGMLRVVLKPLVKQIPLVGAVTVYFLSTPSIDFNLTKMADVLDMPGLSDLLRKAILDQLASLMVLPNKFPVQLIPDLTAKAMKFVKPMGVLRVEVVAGRDLIKADMGMLGMGKSDPYAIISLGAQEFRTPVIKNTINPKWHYILEAVVNEAQGMNLDIEVMDEDQNTKDDFLGRISIAITKLINKKNNDLWFELEDIKSGEINLVTTWLSLKSDATDYVPPVIEKKTVASKCTLSTAILLVFLDSARHLPNASKASSEPSPIAHLSVGNDKKTSLLLNNTNDPVWEENFQFLVQNPELQELNIQIFDNKTDKSLGEFTFHILRLLKENNLTLEQPFLLRCSGHNAKVFMTLQLLILKSEGEDRTPSHKNISVTSTPSKDGSKDGIPSIEQMVRSTVTPILNTTDLKEEILEVAMKSSTPSVSEPSLHSEGSTCQGPRIQLTLRFSTPRNKLIVVVHRIVDLTAKPGEDIPDPYVKLQLFPEGKDSKQKTHSIKDTCKPVFDETLQFDINPSEIKVYTLEVKVCSKSGSMFAKSNVMCQTTLDLSQLDITKAITDWYELEEVD